MSEGLDFALKYFSKNNNSKKKKKEKDKPW